MFESQEIPFQTYSNMSRNIQIAIGGSSNIQKIWWYWKALIQKQIWTMSKTKLTPNACNWRLTINTSNYRNNGTGQVHSRDWDVLTSPAGIAVDQSLLLRKGDYTQITWSCASWSWPIYTYHSVRGILTRKFCWKMFA